MGCQGSRRGGTERMKAVVDSKWEGLQHRHDRDKVVESRVEI
jgi:hypothetical protein